jgi:hypothetical protein
MRGHLLPGDAFRVPTGHGPEGHPAGYAQYRCVAVEDGFVRAARWGSEEQVLLPFSDVRALDVKRSRARQGAVVGAALGGLAVMGFLGWLETKGTFNGPAGSGLWVIALLAGAMPGALVGVIVGAVLTRWERVPSAPPAPHA